MLRLLLNGLFLVGFIHAQGGPAAHIITGPTTPLHCSPLSGDVWVQTTGTILTATGVLKVCDTPDHWASVAGATVSSVLGTANQISVSCPAGICTLSLPTGLIFPGSVNFIAGTTAASSFRILSGVAKTTPIAGDFWNLAGALQYHDGTRVRTIQASNPDYTAAVTFPGIASGSIGLSVNDVAGTAILYLLPVTSGVGPLFNTGPTTCPTTDPSVTSNCNQWVWGTRSGNTTQVVTTTGLQTSGDCVKIDANGNHIANGSACGSGSGGSAGSPLFVQNQAITVAGPDGEQPLDGSIASGGSKTIPANWFSAAGATMRVCYGGFLSADAISPGTLRLRLKFTNPTPTTVVIADTGATTIPAALPANTVFSGCLDISAWTVGSSGTLMVNNAVGFSQAIAGLGLGFRNTSVVTINTTVTQVLSLTALWGTADTDNSITVTNLTAESPGSAIATVFGMTGVIPNISGDCTTNGSSSITCAIATALRTTRAIYGNNFDGSAALTQIIASTFGGTGNGFAKFSGPTTSEKTFTLPDASATLTITVASGTSALGTSAIAGNACATVVTTAATGTASTDAISWSPNADISGVTGYGILSTDGLKVYPYPTTNNVNWRVCNGTASSITPGAVTLNWRVTR